MPNHSRRTSRVSRKRKVNRRRTKKGGASGLHPSRYLAKIYAADLGKDVHDLGSSGDGEVSAISEDAKLFAKFSEGFSLLDIKDILTAFLVGDIQLQPQNTYTVRLDSIERINLAFSLLKIVNDKLEESKEFHYPKYGWKKIMDGKYSLGNFRLLPDEKITRTKIQKIIDAFNEHIKYNPPDGSNASSSVVIEIGKLNTIKQFIDSFSPEEPPAEEPPAEEPSADVVNAAAAANLFGQGIEQKNSKDSCRGKNCSIMGGYKKKSKRKSKKKSNRKSKRGGNGCGKRGGNHCNTKKRVGHGHAIHKKK